MDVLIEVPLNSASGKTCWINPLHIVHVEDRCDDMCEVRMAGRMSFEAGESASDFARRIKRASCKD